MMNSGFSTGMMGIGFPILWALHILSVLAFFSGIVLLIILAAKTLTHAQLKTWALWLLVGGAVVCLLTIGMMGHPWGSFGHMRMMNQGWQSAGFDTNGGTSESTEEADGKALFGKLQAGETTCAKLTDSDFELIGEYVMGQRAGASHDGMNAMLKQMMGAEGEEQMHIILAKNATGCGENGVMNGGMMRIGR